MAGRTGNPKFADLGPREKTSAKKFIQSAATDKIADAASPSKSAKTVHSDDQFHLDRQQPSSERYASKVAVQLNKPLVHRGPTTVAQVAVHHDTIPDPESVSARLKHSVHTREEQSLPATSKQDRQAAELAVKEAGRAGKAQRLADKNAAGTELASQGQFKRGGGKPSVSKN